MIALGGLGLFVWTRQKNAKDGQQEQEFIEKYGLDPNTVDLNSLWNEVVQIESKKQLLIQLDQEQKSLNEKVQAFVHEFISATQEKIQTFSDIVSQLNSLQKLLDQSNLAKQHLNDLIIKYKIKRINWLKTRLNFLSCLQLNKVANFAWITDLKKEAEEQEQLKMKIEALQKTYKLI